jgi:4-amino-4-deoxy-L-arabinose transferase-like glycosyltransferase
LKRLALALAFLTAFLGLWFGTSAASGADAYGYVSQADLWLRGTLIIDEPLADEAPWRNANWTLTPFGYRPGDRRGTMVPTYSPGLPMVMAAFKAAGGPNAVFHVVPLLGALTVWLTFLLGARLGGPIAGLVAAVTLLASPAFLFQLMWPMSDVPATTWWLLSMVLAVRGAPAATAGAGLSAALAILTRPNLAPLVLPMLAFVVGRARDRRERLVHGALFMCAMLPGPIAVAVINQHLYQSAFSSGYGTFSTIYQSAHLAPNLAHYFGWLLETQTPYILLALLAPFVLRRREDPSVRAITALALAVSAAVLLSYLWYTTFDSWTYLRFLLPAFPMLLALAAAVLVTIAPSGSGRRALVVGIVVTVVAAWGVWNGRAAFQVRADEARYLAAGRLATGLPASAVIVSNQHSGSLRHYGGRVTLRFEWLDPDMYVPALEHLQRLNRPVYAVLDDWEREVFRARYARVVDLSWLDGPPLVVAADRVYFYAIPPPGSAKTLGYNEKTP